MKGTIRFPHHHTPPVTALADSSNWVSGKLSCARIVCPLSFLEALFGWNLGLSQAIIISAPVHCTTLALPLLVSQDNSYRGLAAPSPLTSALWSCSFMILCLVRSVLTFYPWPAIGKQNTGLSWWGMVLLASPTYHFAQGLGLSPWCSVSWFPPTSALLCMYYSILSNMTYLGPWKLLIRPLKSANSNCFALLRIK